MFNWVDIKVHQERQADLQREANKERLLRKVLKGLPKRKDEIDLEALKRPQVSKN